MRIQHVLPLIFLACLLPGAALAAWQIYGNAISSAPYNQTFPVTVSDGAGGAIVAWRDDRLNNGFLDIYAQRVNGSGAVQWTVNGVAVCTAGRLQYDPQVCSDGESGMIIVWTDQRNLPTSGEDIYAQRVNAAGVPQWASNGVPLCTATGDQQAQQIVSDGDGGAIIIWTDRRDVLGADIYAQRVDGAGSLQWLNNGVALCQASQDQTNPLLVTDMAEGAIGIWRDMRNGQHSDIYTQRINADGVVQWAENGISLRGTVGQDSPRAAASDGAGGAIVVSIDDNDIHGERVNAAGVAQWGPQGVALCAHWSGETDPTCVTDGAGGAIVAWKDLRDPAGDIYAQRVGPSGAVLWWPTGEWVGALPYAQERPLAISDGAGGAIFTWHDLRSNVSYDIYAQRLNAAGDAQWPQNGVAMTNRGSEQKYPVIASDGAGGGIVSWQDIREVIGSTYYTQIYARRVSHGGMALTDVPTSTPSFSLELGDNYPNPFSTGTTFELSLRRDSDVNLEVFDAAGRRVRWIQVGHRKAGSWSIRFDGRDDRARALPSGVYFYRMHAGNETVTKKMVIAR